MPECFFAWFVAPCVQELEDTFLQPHQHAFEWGAGKSTIWLARRVSSVVSIEHDSEWYSRVSGWLNDEGLHNTSLLLLDLNDSYAAEISKYEAFDVILIDGRRRADCIRAAMSCVKRGGFIVVDDAERPQYQKALAMFGNGWERRDWIDGAGKYTSIFFRL